MFVPLVRLLQSKIFFGTMARYDEKQFILEFIEVYKSLPAIWNVNSKDYSNRQKKTEQYGVLLKKYREVYPDADRGDVVKKINSLRSTFRRELRKMKSYAERGISADEVMEPTLYYFEEMLFLEGLEVPSFSFKKPRESSVLDESEVYESDIGHQTAVALSPINNAASQSPTQSPPQTTNYKELYMRKKSTKRKAPDASDSALTAIANHFKQPKYADDCHDVFGKNVAMKLRNIKDNIQRLSAERIINDALFFAEMGKLSVTYDCTKSVLGNMCRIPTPSCTHKRSFRYVPASKVQHVSPD